MWLSGSQVTSSYGAPVSLRSDGRIATLQVHRSEGVSEGELHIDQHVVEIGGLIQRLG